MRVVIAGGGNVGTFIADDLVKAGHEVTIVEVDSRAGARPPSSSASRPGSRWVEADACELSELARADLEPAPTSSPRSPATTRTTSSSRCSPSRSSPCPASSPG